MIDIALQRDSQRRLRDINEDIKAAKERKDAKDVRMFTKELEEEQKVLAMIERVNVA